MRRNLFSPPLGKKSLNIFEKIEDLLLLLLLLLLLVDTTFALRDQDTATQRDSPRPVKKTVIMSASSTSHGGSPNIYPLFFDSILRAVFVGEIISFFLREPACNRSAHERYSETAVWACDGRPSRRYTLDFNC